MGRDRSETGSRRGARMALVATATGLLAGALLRGGRRARRADGATAAVAPPAAPLAPSAPPRTPSGPGEIPDDAGTVPDELRSPDSIWGERFEALKATAKGFIKDHGQDDAAALTYYAVLAMFPAFIALVALLGVVGQESTVTTLVDVVEDVGSEQAAEAFRGPAESVVAGGSGGAGILLVVALAGAVWAASGYIGAFARANNDIWDVQEDRPFWKLKPLQLLITLVTILGAALLATSLALTGPIAAELGDAIGLGSTVILIWQIAKWPVMLIIVTLIVALLYHATPNVKGRGFSLISPGAAVAVVVWLLASAGFAVYVANLGSYNATYGSLGGVIVLILWLWLTNIALLVGARLDATLERGDGAA